MRPSMDTRVWTTIWTGILAAVLAVAGYVSLDARLRALTQEVEAGERLADLALRRVQRAQVTADEATLCIGEVSADDRALSRWREAFLRVAGSVVDAIRDGVAAAWREWVVTPRFTHETGDATIARVAHAVGQVPVWDGSCWRPCTPPLSHINTVYTTCTVCAASLPYSVPTAETRMVDLRVGDEFGDRWSGDPYTGECWEMDPDWGWTPREGRRMALYGMLNAQER